MTNPTPPTDQAPPSARDRHLFGPGHKRILSLDGGGVRGVIALAFLARLEKLIEEIEGKPVLLGDWFDMIGGTSTGAIIATGLSLGYRVADLDAFYRELAPRVFRSSFWRGYGLRAKFDARQLVKELRSIVGDRTLGSEDLRTGLCIVTKRMDTGSPWILMNNPRSQFWETPADGSFIGNRHYPLVNIVRASAAAPNYFDPEPVTIAEGAPTGLFVDGGVSPHNNPALYLLLVANLPPYGLCWPLGAENLTIVSVGTGNYRYRMGPDEMPWLQTIGVAMHSLMANLSDSQQLVLALMTWLGHSPVRWPINSELGDLGQAPPPLNQPLFNFLRYDVKLEQEWLKSELNTSLDMKVLADYRRMDAPGSMSAIAELGALAAERQMHRRDIDLARR